MTTLTLVHSHQLIQQLIKHLLCPLTLHTKYTSIPIETNTITKHQE